MPTKLRAPQQGAAWVRRERLLQLLRSADDARLAVVVAPAGFGKSTLVAQWLAEAPATSAGAPAAYAWLTLDEHDEDAGRFLAYLVGAVEHALQRPLPTVRPLLGTSEPVPVYIIAQALLVDLSALRAPLTLVLDDYHAIAAEAVHQTVGYLLRHLPPHCRLLILTRLDPPLQLARRRAEGQLVEIRAADLRFTVDEAAAMLASLLERDPEQRLVAALHEETEGWAIALQLAALARSTAAHSPAQGRGQIAEYLAEEVFQQQPAAIQEALLALAVPERVCAGLGAALLALPGGELQADELLRRLVRANLFLQPLDVEWRWFRFHHLFRDLLLRRLLLADDVGQLRALRLRAAQWLDDAGLVEEALHLYLAAGDEDAAGALVERVASQTLAADGASARPAHWLRLLPVALVERRPGLALLAARVNGLQVDITTLAAALARVEALLAQRQPAEPASPWPSFAADLAALRGLLLFYQFRPGEAIPALEAVLERPLGLGLADQALIILGRSYIAVGQHAEGRRRIVERSASAGAGWQQTSEATRTITLFTMHALSSNAPLAADELRRLGALADATDESLIMVGYASAGLGRMAYERGDLATAAAYFQQLAGLKYRVSNFIYIFSVIGLTLVAIAREAYAEAETLAQEALAFAEEAGGAFLRHQAHACATRVALARGDLRAALAAAERIERDVHLGLSAAIEAPRLSRVQALIAAGEPATLAQADLLLADCLAEIERFHNIRLQLRAIGLLALLRQAQRRPDEAQAAMERALLLAAPHGFLRTFVELGPPLLPLLRAMGSRGVTPAYVQQLRAAFEPPAAPAAPAQLIGPVAGLPEMLTRRELEILALLDARWSDKEIAERLTIALSTVRKHTSTIYGKLGVGGRREAVQLARALGLLPAP